MNKEKFSLSWRRQWSVKDERPEKTTERKTGVHHFSIKRKPLRGMRRKIIVYCCLFLSSYIVNHCFLLLLTIVFLIFV